MESAKIFIYSLSKSVAYACHERLPLERPFCSKGTATIGPGARRDDASPARAAGRRCSCCRRSRVRGGDGLAAGGRRAPGLELNDCAQAGDEVVDAVAAQFGGGAPDAEAGTDLQDRLHLAQAVLAECLARRDEIDDAIGEPDQRRDLDRSVELDDLRDDAARLQMAARQLGELRRVAQVDARHLVDRAILRLGDGEVAAADPEIERLDRK